MRVMTLDWKQFSEEAFNEFKEALKEYELYLGDAIEDYYGENSSDTYVLYINKSKLKPNELKDSFPFLTPIDES